MSLSHILRNSLGENMKEEGGCTESRSSLNKVQFMRKVHICVLEQQIILIADASTWRPVFRLCDSDT